MSTPKVVVDAVFPDEIIVGKYTLRPLSLANMLLLEKVDSPFTRTAEEKKERGDKPPDGLDIIRALFILTRSTEELQAMYEGFSRPRFEKEAWKFGSGVRLEETAALGKKFEAIFNAATSTMMGGSDAPVDTDDEEEKKSPIASKASTARAKTMDSAGH